MSLFPPPQDVATEVFAELPQTYRKRNQRSVWADGTKLGARIDSFIEGPSIDRDGNLYIVDLTFGRIFRLSPEKEFTLVADNDGEPTGLKLHQHGRIFHADLNHGSLPPDQ